jgi:hypothetical protein
MLPVLAFAVLLAGCSGEDPASPASLPDASTSPSSTAAAVQAQAPVQETVAVTFDGNLGTLVHACVLPADACHSQAAVADHTDLYVERPGANFTGLDLTVTWTAQTPEAATLGIGYMVMASCDGCNSTSYEEVMGQSPLHVTLSGEGVPLTPDAKVHVYVYNPQGFVYDPAVPAYAFASVDQAFHVEGTVSLLAPATPGAQAA